MNWTPPHFTSDHYMIFLLLIVVGAIGYSFVQQQRDETSSFNLLDLLMHKGRLSGEKCIVMGGWATHTFLIYYWAFQGSVKSEDMLVYAGIWITPTLTRIIKGTPPPSDDSSTIVTPKENVDGNKS